MIFNIPIESETKSDLVVLAGFAVEIELSCVVDPAVATEIHGWCEK